MKVTLDNYVELAVRTESPASVEKQDRFEQTSQIIQFYMTKMIDLGNDLDRLKKFLFYAKGAPPEMTEASLMAGWQTMNLRTERVMRLMHCAIGMATETGELFEALYAHIFMDKELDPVNICEELGDASWYQAIGLDELQISLQKMLQINHDKLLVRYPEKFTAKLANERDLDAERQVLEGRPVVEEMQGYSNNLHAFAEIANEEEAESVMFTECPTMAQIEHCEANEILLLALTRVSNVNVIIPDIRRSTNLHFVIIPDDADIEDAKKSIIDMFTSEGEFWEAPAGMTRGKLSIVPVENAVKLTIQHVYLDMDQKCFVDTWEQLCNGFMASDRHTIRCLPISAERLGKSEGSYIIHAGKTENFTTAELYYLCKELA